MTYADLLAEADTLLRGRGWTEANPNWISDICSDIAAAFAARDAEIDRLRTLVRDELTAETERLGLYPWQNNAAAKDEIVAAARSAMAGSTDPADMPNGTVVSRPKANKLRRAIDRLGAGTPDASRWQPIETAPKNEPVLLYSEQIRTDHDKVHYRTPLIIAGYFDGIDEAWCCMGSTWEGPFFKPTHWRPLPAAPRQVNRNRT